MAVTTPSTMDTDLFAMSDPNDYPVLYSAIVGQADVIVTGDKDFEDVHLHKVSIMTSAKCVDDGAAQLGIGRKTVDWPAERTDKLART